MECFCTHRKPSMVTKRTTRVKVAQPSTILLTESTYSFGAHRSVVIREYRGHMVAIGEVSQHARVLNVVVKTLQCQ